MPQILLIEIAPFAFRLIISKHAVRRMAAPHAGGFHTPRRRKIGRAQAHAVHARAGGGDFFYIIDPLGGFQDGVNHDRFADLMPGFQLGQQLIKIMNVPGAFHFRQHDHIDLVAYLRDNLGNIIQKPRTVQAVDPGP